MEPTKEDVTKIHNQINQELNQRFAIALAAMTMTGLALSWILPLLTTRPEVCSAISVILLVLLLALYGAEVLLLRDIIVMNMYLRATGRSAWETDIEAFYEEAKGAPRLRWRMIHVTTISFLFVIFGIVAALPFLLAICRFLLKKFPGVCEKLHMASPGPTWQENPILLSTLMGVALLVYISSVLWWLPKFHGGKFRETVESKWLKIKGRGGDCHCTDL